MKQTQRVIGYDYRIPLDATDPLWRGWDAERRRSFLLRTEVELPLSADSYVWPSALKDGAWDMLPDDDDPRENAIAWKHLMGLEKVIGTEHSRDGVLIAIAEVCAIEHRRIAKPASLPPAAVFLGYDVVDESNLSVLMNHGRGKYDAPEVIAARSAQWSPRLNDHHLFASVAAAAAFSSEAKEDDLAATGGEGHGQFCVMGLWALGWSLPSGSPGSQTSS